ncbi:hypothetical protein OHB36_25215 [Streptomyces sp. NBC_00320]|uniref:hypothetical protein n=1 Tax=Streptomyces sp. NBC_00320 TaxID=2975711 RepID=UPI00225399C9|nr:hypothetical protein [Streptomyces sp. NBC_00320]MCX5150026.1 hypothetical protein [Streptomyces sp. NBC_00320]
MRTREETVVNPFDVVLTGVEYVPGDPWFLGLRWQAGDGTPAPAYRERGGTGAPGNFPYATQLFSSAVAEPRYAVGKPVAADGDTSGTWDQKRAGYTLKPGSQYWIAVVGNPPSMASNTVAVLWQPPSFVSVTCDGTALDVAWAPGGAGATGAVATLTAGGAEVWRGSAAPAAPSAAAVASRFDVAGAPLALAPGTLTLTLRPTATDAHAVSTGPAAVATAYTHPPVVLTTAYASGSAATGLSYAAEVAPAGNTGLQYAVTLLDGRARLAGPTLVTATPDGDTAVLNVVVPRVPSGSPLALVVAAADQVATGPASAPFPLLAVAPSVEEAVCAVPGTVELLLRSPTGATFVTVTEAEAPVATAVVEGRTGRIDVPAGTGPYAVTAAAVAGAATGVPGAPVPLLTAHPVLVSAAYDGTTVTARWTEAAGSPAAYRLRVLSGGVVVATAPAGSTSGAVDVRVDGELADGRLIVDVTGVTGPVVGPASGPLPLVTRAPRVTAAATDPATGTTAVAWQATTGATSYLVQAFRDGLRDGEPRTVTTPCCDVTLTPGADAAIAVAAVVSTTTTTVTGPFGDPYPLPTAQPVVSRVAFDGADATVSWLPVEGATGYRATALAARSAGSGRAPVGATEVTFAVDTMAGGDYTVVVQALRGADAGPPSPPVPLVPESWFLSAGPATTAYPYVYTSAGVAPAAGDVTVALPGLGTSFTGPVEKDAFRVDASGRTLTVRAVPFTPEAVRTTLREAYAAFLTAVEEKGADAVGVALLQQAVSRAMPQTFAETLYYAYGLDADAGYVDLRPGVVLRVAFADYVNAGQSAPPLYVNGWVGTGHADYDVTPWTAADGRRLALDAFLAQLVATGAFSVGAPAGSGNVVSGLADAADLFGVVAPPRYLRLFAPERLAAADAVGTARTSSGFAIAAAGSWAAIEAAGRDPGPGCPAVDFRGRAVLRACVRVFVDGAEAVVPIGTTVGDMLARHGRRPPHGAGRATGVALDRATGPIPVNGGYDVAASRIVRFDWEGLAEYGPGLDAFSLPLLAGDRVTTR